ncbi:MAG TPA: DUF72 domain-containing protein [Caulobacteraceae bacterium]|jgi:uncharacterized protein YecE (DUF72 family)|nr:DUF72 domain-containing protein [Caulobacteraceae bacterium]
MALRIGCSGWAYADWNGPFYPKAVKAKDRLAWYATKFDTCEINASFYHLPPETTVAAWRDGAPAGFCFAWKVSRFISHNKKLRDCAGPVQLVFGRMAPLAGKQGPALIQLPPMLKADPQRLADFIGVLPAGLRCAFEFRHPSWYDDPVFELLRRYDLALVISDHHHAPAPWVATASWVYIRGHGPSGRYFGRYPEAALDDWADRIGAWRGQGRDVFCYFDNDVKSAAPADAAVLKRLCGRPGAPSRQEAGAATT